MILDKYLNESTYFGSMIDFEPMEGYGDSTGAIRAVSESASDMRAIEMSMIVADVKSLSLSESAAMQLQENAVTSVLEKIKQVIIKMGRKMMAFFEKVIVWLSRFVSPKTFLNKYKGKIKPGVEISVQGYKFTIDAVNLQSVYDKAYDVAKTATEKVAVDAKNTATKDDVKTIEDAMSDVIDKKSDTTEKMYASSYSDADDASSFKSELFKALRNGEDTKDEITDYSVSDLENDLKSADKSIKAVRNAQNTVKSAHNAALKEIDKTQKTFKSSETKDDNAKKYNTKAAAGWQERHRLAVACLGLMNTAADMKVKAIQDNQRQSQLIARAVLLHGGLDSKWSDEKQSQSAADDIENIFKQFNI